MWKLLLISVWDGPTKTLRTLVPGPKTGNFFFEFLNFSTYKKSENGSNFELSGSGNEISGTSFWRIILRISRIILETWKMAPIHERTPCLLNDCFITVHTQTRRAPESLVFYARTRGFYTWYMRSSSCSIAYGLSRPRSRHGASKTYFGGLQ